MNTFSTLDTTKITQLKNTTIILNPLYEVDS